MQRRTFLQASMACGAGGLLVVSRRSKGAEGDTPTPLNVALIGAGLQGRILATAAVSIPHLRFRAICDIWNYSRKTVGYLLRRYDHEVNEYADYRELLEKEADLDAVLIATPDFAHAEQ
ncbi:MAG: Gfo/Idh/MocA family oxidoreductase, partial [Planctomycetes bacterium]|nr:Gfo/Idh/MocA family oxidoreductase [Planctomycetota bacterium]